MDVAPLSSHPNFPWIAGIRPSATPPTPTPSWIASYTMPIASNSPAKVCAAHAQNKPGRLDQTSSSVRQIHRPASLATGRHHSVTVGGIIQESWAALSRYRRAASSESAAKTIACDWVPPRAPMRRVAGMAWGLAGDFG